MCDPVELAKMVPQQAVDNLVVPASKEGGKTLALIPRAINAALLPLEKWILHREYSLEETKKLLAHKLKDVPEEKIVPPEPYVAVPALQAISYCMDSEELREMFANLLATSMNADTKDDAHPAYVNIINQLSPLDAKVLKYINSLRYSQKLPLCEIRLQESAKLEVLSNMENNQHPFRPYDSGYTLLRNFIILDNIVTDSESLCLTIDNILRLGIMSVPRGVLSDYSLYLPFITHPTFLKYQSTTFSNSNMEVVLIRSHIEPTNFGKALFKAIL